MFPSRYFAPSYFAPRYFSSFGDDPAPDPTTGLIVECVAVFKPLTQTFLVRAWLQNRSLKTINNTLDFGRCRCFVKDEAGVELFRAIGSIDPAGGQYVVFEIPGAQFAIAHAYVMEITIKEQGSSNASWGQFPLGTVG